MSDQLVAEPLGSEVVTPAIVGKRPPPRLVYEGRGGRVAAIALTNGLLNIPTFGFYRFWGKTRLRRYIWSRLFFLGEPLEYSGAAKELLFGFLIALFVLLPLFLAPQAIGLIKMDLHYQVGVSVAQVLILVYLVNFAIFRARRYRLSRTQWRGIRAGQSGAGRVYAAKALAWGFLMLATLGLTYPVYRTRLQSYVTENTWFGDRRFEFEGRAGAMFGTWLIAWFLFLPTLGLSYVWYRVREFRYFASVTRVGTLRFRSDLEAATPILLVMAYGIILSMAFGLLAVGFGLVVAGGSFGSLEQIQQAQENGEFLFAYNAAIIALSLLFILIYGVVRIIILVQPILAAICRTLTIEGEEDYDAIAQSQQFRPGRGEGLADGLDVGAF